jgi:hypothetical protein
MFEAMKHGDHRPWKFLDVYTNDPWNFDRLHTQPLQNTVDGPLAAQYWFSLLDKWADLCFQFGKILKFLLA